MQRPKTSRTKPRGTKTCQVPSYISSGVWCVIFSYLGMTKDLANCRLVCKKWRKNVHKSIQYRLIQKKNSFDTFKQACLALKESLPETAKENIESALEMKAEYEEYIELIPKKYSLFHRISDLGKLITPPVILCYGIMSVLHLLTDKDELKSSGGLNWRYCKKRLVDKGFMKRMREMTPEKITQGMVTRFRDLVNASLITPEQLARESTQVCFMMEWALKIVEYKEFVRDLDEEAKKVLKEFNKQESLKKEIESLDSILAISAN